MATKFDTRQSIQKTGLPMVGTTAGAQLDTILPNIDAELSKLYEDRNIILTGGGTITYTVGDQITVTEALSLELNQKVAGGTPSSIGLGTGAWSFSANGRMTYAVIDRLAGTAIVTSDASALPAVVAANQEVFLIAKRVDTSGGAKRVYFRNGLMLPIGSSSAIGGGTSAAVLAFTGMDSDSDSTPDYAAAVAHTLRFIQENSSLETAISRLDDQMDKSFGQLRIKPGPSGFRAQITGADVTMLDTSVRGQMLSNLRLAFTGAQISFGGGDAGTVYAADGTTPLGINFTMAAIPNGEYRWFSITLIPAAANADGSINGQLIVSPGSDTNPSSLIANKPAFADGIPLGYIRILGLGGTIDSIGYSDIVQMGIGSGGGGSGSGGGNPILESIKNQLVDSPFELVTPNIISTMGGSGFATLTGATYDIANKVIKFSANSQTAVSTNQLDPVEFLSRGLDITEIDLTLYWNRGSSLQAFAVPTGFTYEVSRDGGNNYFPIEMEQVGSTETFRGPLRFDTPSTTESTQSSLQAVSGGTQTDLDLNATTTQQISSTVVVPSGQTWTVKRLLLTLTKTGVPAGNVFVSLVSDNAGVPSTALGSVLSQTNAITANSLVTGSNSIDLPATVLVAGTYHFVVSSDAAYKAGFSGVNKLQVKESSSASGESSYNGTIWTTVPAKALVATVQGRNLDLRLRITSAGSPTYPVGLDGYGLFYNPQEYGLTGENRKTQRFVFNSVADNLNSFTITSFNPDPDLLSIYYVEGGQIFKAPSFSLYGNTVVFPANSFNNGGISATITLIADQNNGGTFDNSDSNARLLAANFLGSTNGADDRSAAGRGIFLRRPDGTLREIAINDSDEIVIYSV